MGVPSALPISVSRLRRGLRPFRYEPGGIGRVVEELERRLLGIVFTAETKQGKRVVVGEKYVTVRRGAAMGRGATL